jgi:hypothetical protein
MSCAKSMTYVKLGLREEGKSTWKLAGVVMLAMLALARSAMAQQSTAASPRSATMAEQKMCDEQARKKFYEDYRGTAFANYTSHFDSRVSVCYVFVHHATVANDMPSVSKVVYDAFEGRVYASYMWINSKGLKYWEVAPIECAVKPRGRAEIGW